jgi:hypothetical protein
MCAHGRAMEQRDYLISEEIVQGAYAKVVYISQSILTKPLRRRSVLCVK